MTATGATKVRTAWRNALLVRANESPCARDCIALHQLHTPPIHAHTYTIEGRSSFVSSLGDGQGLRKSANGAPLLGLRLCGRCGIVWVLVSDQSRVQ